MRKQKPKYNARDEQKLMSEIWSPRIADNPYNFVMFAYPWGKPGTPLEHYSGPRSWQKEVLLEIAEHIQSNKKYNVKTDNPKMFRMAVSSGRGIGKSALVAWLNHWHMSCHIGATAITTANSETQLKTRTWAELGKWKTLAINGHWFEVTAMRFFPAEWFADLVKDQLQIDTTYYYSEAQLWSEENPDAFAGVHNPKGVMLLKDEASGISQNIWDVSSGFFTDRSHNHYYFAFSNPRRNSGAFYECFHKHRDQWHRKQIDSRKVEGLNSEELQAMIDKYGEDSYHAMVEVKGMFPSQGERQFIPRELVQSAVDRETVSDSHAGLIMGVDVARYGDDKSVFFFRQGRDARSIPSMKFSGKSNMEIANIAAEMINKYNPNSVCIDAGGGAGVIDRLRELGYKVNEVWFGSKSSISQFRDKRAELWGEMKEWLRGGMLPSDPDLVDDLCAPEYDFDPRTESIFLEPKDKIKKRGLASPDIADAFACTFSVKVSRSGTFTSRGNKARVAEGIEYDIFTR